MVRGDFLSPVIYESLNNPVLSKNVTDLHWKNGPRWTGHLLLATQ